TSRSPVVVTMTSLAACAAPAVPTSRASEATRVRSQAIEGRRPESARRRETTCWCVQNPIVDVINTSTEFAVDCQQLGERRSYGRTVPRGRPQQGPFRLAALPTNGAPPSFKGQIS